MRRPDWKRIVREHHLHLLACPRCRGALTLRDARSADGRVESGALRCAPCAADYPIRGHVPRFVPPENYATGFGLQWNKHARTQYDSHTGTTISADRFFHATRWPRALNGEKVLEVGCGAGRFTEVVAATGATLVSLDYSSAVEANCAGNGRRDNVLIVQGDVYQLPFRPGAFDRVFCLGVIQHTPDPRRAFLALPPQARAGGHLAVDLYRKFPWWLQVTITKYWARPLTSRMDPARLYRRVDRYVRFMWPLACALSRLPLGRQLNWRLLIADYRGKLPLREADLKQWAILDTYDMLAPAYDFPQTFESAEAWFREAGLTDIEVGPGYNGIEARGRKP